jgi:hypothetical protein
VSDIQVAASVSGALRFAFRSFDHLDGIRASRPLGSGGPLGPSLDDLDIARDDLGFGPGPSMPIDAPSGWFHRNDGIDLPGDVVDMASWAVGGQPMASPLAPGDGLDWSDSLPGLDAADGVDLVPLPADDDLFAPTELGSLPFVYGQFALDGVDDTALSLAGSIAFGRGDIIDTLDFSGDEGVAGGTFFPMMYRTDPGDGADPAPEDALAPPAASDLDGIAWAELEPAGVPLEDDAIFLTEIEPLAILQTHA